MINPEFFRQTEKLCQSTAGFSAYAANAMDNCQEFYRTVVILPFDSQMAVKYGLIRNCLENAGEPLDNLIAARALAVGVCLVTSN